LSSVDSNEATPPPESAQLWTAEQAADADAHTIDRLGLPSAVLMERASLAVVEELSTWRSDDAPVVVLVGPGNNGGDGLATARLIAERGIPVTAFLVTERRNEACARQLALARATGVTIEAGVPADGECARRDAWVVDALLGTGARGAPRDAVADAVKWCRGRRCLAIDVPTGVDASDGRCPGPSVIAQRTVTFERSKPGLHVSPGRDHAGTVIVARIGLRAAPSTRVKTRLIDPWRLRLALTRAATPTHKGERGHVGLLAGGGNTPGAAALAGTAALRAGAGLATIRMADASARATLVARRPELMTESPSCVTVLDRADVLVVGPGLTDDDHGVDLATLWRDDPRPAVWDASGLAAIGEGRSSVAGPRIVTPHPGEAARLLDRADRVPPGQGAWSSAHVQSERLAAARRLSGTYDAVVVLKGAGTIVAHPDGEAWIATAGGPELATGGTGDVLAGLLGSLWARHPRLEGLWPDPCFAVAALGVHLHAVAGALARKRRRTPLALDVAEALDAASELGASGAAWDRAGIGYVRTRWA